MCEILCIMWTSSLALSIPRPYSSISFWIVKLEKEWIGNFLPSVFSERGWRAPPPLRIGNAHGPKFLGRQEEPTRKEIQPDLFLRE